MEGGWAEAVAASDAHENMQAVGWSNVQTGKEHGNFDYCTQGIGCVEVEIDVLTGELALLRADLLMDQGAPLNPDVDLGQVEGGFTMALGLFLTEELLWAADGTQRNIGSWEYKIPAAHDIPLALNVSFLPKAPNPSAVAALHQGLRQAPMASAPPPSSPRATRSDRRGATRASAARSKSTCRSR